MIENPLQDRVDRWASSEARFRRAVHEHIPGLRASVEADRKMARALTASRTLASGLKQVIDGGEPLEIVRAEQCLVRHERKELAAGDPELTASLDIAAEELEVAAAGCIFIRDDPDEYRRQCRYHYKLRQKRRGGWPYDPVRTVAAAHTTRLRNRRRAPKPQHEKDLERLRGQGMTTVGTGHLRRLKALLSQAA